MYTSGRRRPDAGGGNELLVTEEKVAERDSKYTHIRQSASKSLHHRHIQEILVAEKGPSPSFDTCFAQGQSQWTVLGIFEGLGGGGKRPPGCHLNPVEISMLPGGKDWDSVQPQCSPPAQPSEAKFRGVQVQRAWDPWIRCRLSLSPGPAGGDNGSVCPRGPAHADRVGRFFLFN